MRQIFFLVLLFITTGLFAQAPSNYTNINGRYRWIAGMFDSTFHIPKGTTTSLRTGGSTNAGALFYRTTDSSVYYYTGTQWLRVAGAAGFVPYTGATQNVNLGQFGLTTKFIQFDTSSQAVTDRRLQWSNDEGTLQFGMTNGATITQRVGLEQFARVKNLQGDTIEAGDVVYISGASGDRAAVKLADNRADSTSSKTLGVATEQILPNDVGLVGTFGVVGKLNLSAFTAGDVVYLDSIPGKLTKVKPQAPYHMVFVGVVERANAGNGLLFVNVQNGYELEELHNVRITSPVPNRAILTYDSVRSLWVDTTLNAIGGITGSGTSGQVSYFNGTNSITGSNNLFWDIANVRLGIATNSPQSNFHIYSTESTANLNIGQLLIGGSPSVTNDIFGGMGTHRTGEYFWVQGRKAGVKNINFLINPQGATNVGINSTTVDSYITETNGLVVHGNPGGQISLVSNRTSDASAGIFAFWNATTRLVDLSAMRSGADNTGAFRIRVSNAGSLTEVMRIFSTGNTVIQNGGTFTDAGFRLDVNGTARVQGNITGTGTTNSFSLDVNNRRGVVIGSVSNLGSVELRGDNAYSGFLYFQRSTTTNVSMGFDNGLATPGFIINNTLTNPFYIRSSGQVVFDGSITAASAIARGVNFTNTLVAAANNDVLVGLDINPTFTNGAFTGVSNYGIRYNSSNAITPFFFQSTVNGTAYTYNTLGGNNDFFINSRDVLTSRFRVQNGGANGVLIRSFNNTTDITNEGTNNRIILYNSNYFYSTGNVGINQNTDAGFRLDVNGTARVQGQLTVSTGGAAITGAISATSNLHRFGNIQVLTSSTPTSTGVGMTCLGTERDFEFYGGGAAAGTNMFSFNHWNLQTIGVTNVDRSIVRIYSGFTDGNINNLSGNHLWLSPTYNFAGTRTGIVVRGLYYSPTLTSLTNTVHRAIETTTGDVVFGSTSGNVMIGTTTAGGRFTIQPDNNQVGMAISGSSLTGSNAQSLVSLSQTWNTTGNPTAFLLNITNTASGATADLMELQVGGVSQFTVGKSGTIQTTAPSGGTAKPWKLGNVAVVSPTSPDRTIEVEIDGVTYYIHAKTTNN